jgi:hypothetical protein
MRKQALIEAESKSLMLLTHNLAIHTYFSHELKPKLFILSEPLRSPDYFEPTWMSSTYAIRQIDHYFKSLGKSEYYYKESAINARTPENEADPFEKTFLEQLNKDPKLIERSEIRTLNGQPFFITLRRGEKMEGSCLRCHSTPDRAPGNLVKIYGSTRSFGRRLGEEIHAISIRIPLAEAYSQANRLSWQLSGILLALLGVLFASQTWISKRWLFDPMEAIRHKAQEIVDCEAGLGETIPVPAGPELRDLTTAFNTMSSNLRQSHDSLEERVRARTAELNHLNEQLEQDITARKAAEETLRITRESLKLALNGADLGTWDWNVPTGALEFNERWAEMLGYRKEEVEPHRRSWEKLVHPEDLPAVLEVLNAHLEGKTPFYETEYRMRRKSGAWVWVLDKGKVIERDTQGRPRRACGTHLDITQRKRLEESLKIEQQELKLILDSAPMIIFYKDREGRFLRVNKAFAKRLSLAEEKFIGKTVFDFYPPTIAQGMTNDDHEVLQSGLSKLNIIEKYPSASGIRWVQTDKIPIYGEHGLVVGLVGFAQDITERRQAEEALAEEAIRRRILVEQSRDGIVVLDQTGKVYEANQRYAEMLGYSAEEVRELYVWDWDAHWSREELLEMLQLVDATGDHFETRHRRKDGTFLDVEISTNGAVLRGRKLVFCVSRY